MFSPDKWFTNPSTGFYSKTINQSLRFNNDDTPRLTRTWGAAATDDTTWTVSMWVKRSSQDGGGWHTLFAEESEAWTVCAFYNDTIYIQINAGGAATHIQTNRLFRDFSSFYHIVVAFDEDNGTAAHRLRLYVNGVEETSFATDGRSSISSSSNSNWNTNGKSCAIGARSASNNSRNFDGYMAEFHNIDGQQLTPSSFGETKDGVWIPKAYSGSHGDNGFYLPFDDSSAIGDDESANTNDWTVTNLAATDVVLTSPTNTFATMNPVSQSTTANWTLSEGSLHCAAPSSSGWQSVRGTHGVSSGKWYWEVEFDAGTMTEIFCGIMNQNTVPHATSDFNDTTGVVLFYNHTGGEIRHNNTLTDNNYGTLSAGDILGVALNMDDKQLSFYKNGSAIVTNFDIDITGITTVVPAAASDGYSVVLKFNFGQDSANVSSANADDNGIGTFEYAPPSGFLALCTSNLPDPTIGSGQATQADDHFDTLLWTGNGTNAGDSQEINGLSFTPDLVWTKGRGGDGSNPASGQQYHELHDSVRGAGKRVFSNDAAAESDVQTLKSFDNDGFTVAMGTGAQSGTNQITTTMVGWSWKAGGAPTADNSAANNAEPTAGSAKIDGSNQSGAFSGSPSIAIKRLSASTTAGISIVKWTGTGSAGTIPHGLGAAPDFYVVKNLTDSGTSWQAYHVGIASDAETDYIYLNSTAAAGDADDWNDTAPTANVFSVKTHNQVNASGDEYLAYLFTSIEGFSKHASYVGNGSANGTFVYTGFRPAWIMVKQTSGGTTGWLMYDTARDTFNEADAVLQAHVNTAEVTAADIDILSNGWKFRTNDSAVNGSGANYVYLAFAEAPFKFANAR